MIKRRVTKKTTRSTKKTRKVGRRVRGSFLGIGEGKSTALVVARKSEARYPDAYIPPKKRKTVIISSDRPSPRSEGISYSTRSDIGNPTVGSKAYKDQIKKAQLQEKRERAAREKEAKHLAELEKYRQGTEYHTTKAKLFESLARERKAKATSRRRSIGTNVGRSLYNAVNPYKKKRTRRSSSLW